jgi:HEAT repeat protein
VEEAAERVLSMEGEERMQAQQRFMTTYRDRAERFLPLYQETDEVDAQKFYVWALGEVGTDEACDDVAQIVSETSASADPSLKMAVANASARCEDYAPLRTILTESAAVLRAKAAVQLGLHEDTASRETIRQLANNDEYERYHVFFNLALGLLGDEDQKDLLRQLLRQRDARVYAAMALGRMGEESVVVDLQMALEDPEASIRLHAIEALMELRVSGTDRNIRQLLDDPDPRVRQKAEWAIRRINRRPRSSE